MSTHHILWHFEVSVEARLNFEAAYGPHGPWTALFREHDDYLGTDLIRTGPNSYITIDRWRSEAAYQRFHRSARREYGLVSAACTPLSQAQIFLGAGPITLGRAA